MESRADFRISIHALLAESDPDLQVESVPAQQFLSTLSLRRATPCKSVLCWVASYFYPRSPCGERPIGAITYVVMTPDFYPRSPCGERREYWVGGYGTANNFYPRSPCGERHTEPSSMCTKKRFLSTLSLRRATKNAITAAPQQEFLSTLSLRRATFGPGVGGAQQRISIHALLAESDSKSAQNSGALLRI